jgi:hypothetical protein
MSKGQKVLIGIAVILVLVFMKELPTIKESFSSNKKTVDYTNDSRMVNVVDKDTVIEQLKSFISGTDAEELSKFNSEVLISEEDKLDNLEVNNYYFFNSAYYIQVKSGNSQYMYRFQIDTNNIIQSYIKYSLEG